MGARRSDARPEGRALAQRNGPDDQYRSYRRVDPSTSWSVAVLWSELITDGNGRERRSDFAATKVFSTLDSANLYRARIHQGAVIPAAAIDVDVTITELRQRVTA
jgi:hypothetical protein